MKAFAVNKLFIGLAQIVLSLFDREENTVRQDKILVTSIYSFSLNAFKRLLSQGCLPNNKILDFSKLKAFAEDQLNVAQNEDFSLP